MRKVLRWCILIVSVITFAISIGIIIWYYSNRAKDQEKIDELKEIISTEDYTTKDTTGTTTSSSSTTDKYLKYYIIDGTVVQAKYKDIYIKNHDYIGWLQSDNTKIDYPIVYTPDNTDYYLRKDFDRNYSIGGTLLFGAGADIEKPTDNIFIYGHRMSDGSMFGSLENYLDEDYYLEHKYFQMNTLVEDGTYEVVAAFRTKSYFDDPNIFSIYTQQNLTKDQFEQFKAVIKELTKYKTIDISYGDKFITLSTCSYYTTNGRFVVIAKKIKSIKVDLTKDPIEVINTK